MNSLFKELIRNFPLVKWIAKSQNYIKNYRRYNSKKCRIDFNSSLINSRLEGHNTISSGVKLNNVLIGRYSYIANNTVAYNCTIGRFTSIGPNVSIGLGLHPINLVSTSPIFYSNNNPLGVTFVAEKDLKFSENKKISIGNDVWIGAGVKLLDGITIGDGAIVGAGAFVNKNIPPYAVVVGVPGRIIKYRFNEDKVDKLKTVKWWEEDDKWIQRNSSQFMNIDEFLENTEL